MSALAVLKLVVSKKNRTVSPVIHKREKLTAKLAEQIAFLKHSKVARFTHPSV